MQEFLEDLQIIDIPQKLILNCDLASDLLYINHFTDTYLFNSHGYNAMIGAKIVNDSSNDVDLRNGISPDLIYDDFRKYVPYCKSLVMPFLGCGFVSTMDRVTEQRSTVSVRRVLVSFATDWSSIWWQKQMFSCRVHVERTLAENKWLQIEANDSIWFFS